VRRTRLSLPVRVGFRIASLSEGSIDDKLAVRVLLIVMGMYLLVWIETFPIRSASRDFWGMSAVGIGGRGAYC